MKTIGECDIYTGSEIVGCFENVSRAGVTFKDIHKVVVESDSGIHYYIIEQGYIQAIA